jgi:hypothetical protein
MSSRVAAIAALLALTSCVAYFESPADPTAIAVEIRQRPGGKFTFAMAVARAFEQNATLQALAARARAAGAVTTPVELEAEYRSGTEMLAVMVDPIALLGLGPRGGAIGVVEAEAAVAAQELAAGRWRVLAAIAEAFAIDEALADLTAPQIPIHADAFERAGLAGPTVAARVRAAQANADAEAVELANARSANLAELCEVLGLSHQTDIELLPLPEGLLYQPLAADASLLQRPDLALATARFQTADAEFRRAVADQYPSLMLGPEIPLLGNPLEAMAILRVPIGRHGVATAASERREAARAELTAAYLAATREAHHAELESTATTAKLAAATASNLAAEQVLRSAMVAVEVDTDAFDRVAEAADMAVRSAMEHRQATVAAARARVRAAVVYGWPLAKEKR